MDEQSRDMRTRSDGGTRSTKKGQVVGVLLHKRKERERDK